MKKFTSQEIKEFVSRPLFDEKVILNKDTSCPEISIVTLSYNQAEFRVPGKNNLKHVPYFWGAIRRHRNAKTSNPASVAIKKGYEREYNIVELELWKIWKEKI